MLRAAHERFLELLENNSQQSIPLVMADFFQDGSMATLHRLGKPNIEQLERELLEFSTQAPIALALPCHVKELGTSALRSIIKELKNIQHLKQIVIGVDGANAANWERAKRIFGQLPQKPILIWNDGPHPASHRTVDGI